ncbi:MAG: aminoacyl-tRNA hydrolase [Pseudomonadota bacterium]
MRLVVGLGNPGAEYQMNRHNVGFMVVDQIQHQANFPEWSAKFKGLCTKKDDVILLKPQTYMNLSGQSIQACMTFFKLTVDDLWVVHDDIELLLGEVQTKTGGSAKGHNGLRSLDQCMGQNYHRVRCGVGRPIHGAVADYVLSNFSKDEIPALVSMIEAAACRGMGV